MLFRKRKIYETARTSIVIVLRVKCQLIVRMGVAYGGNETFKRV
jgi:hypothetical protein